MKLRPCWLICGRLVSSDCNNLQPRIGRTSTMQIPYSRKKRRLLLSVRVSLLLMLAALLPLIVTIVSSELLSRPVLISQANAAMETDAQAHIQTIANFFSQPIIDVSSL